MTDDGVGDCHIKCALRKVQPVSIADTKLYAVTDAFLVRETTRSLNENRALIDAENDTGKISSAHEKTDDHSCSTPDYQDLRNLGEVQLRGILVKKPCEDSVIGTALKSVDKAFDRGIIKFIDKTIGITHTHASPPVPTGRYLHEHAYH